MPDRTEYYRNYVGVCLSILTILITLSYGTFKMNDLVEFSDYKLFEVKQKNYFSESAEFSIKDGFLVAAAILDPSKANSE